jgi:peroxiredoxin
MVLAVTVVAAAPPPPVAPQPGVPGGKAVAPPMGEFKARFFERFLNKPAPAFRLKSADGREVALGDFKGKPVLLNFWFSSCLPCRQETPDLVALYRLHKDRGLVILGINTDSLMMPDAGAEPMRRFLEIYRMPYPVLLADHAMYRAYGSPPVQPVSFLIDPKGIVAQIFWGARPGAVFERAVKPYLLPAAGAR